MEKYLEGVEPDDRHAQGAASARAPSSSSFFPTYAGSSFKNKGVQLVLDAVVDYLPNPMEVQPQPEVDLKGNPTGEFAIVDPDAARARARVQDHGRPLRQPDLHAHLLGHDHQGHGAAQHLHRQDRAHRPHGRDARQRPHADRLGAGRRHRRAGRPQERADRPHAVRRGQARDARADGVPGAGDLGRRSRPRTRPTPRSSASRSARWWPKTRRSTVEVDRESSETILKGMGELHLDIKVDILRRTHGVEVTVGKPQVAYRETHHASAVDDAYTHKKQTGGSGQYAKIEYTHRARRARRGLRVRVRRSSAAACPRSSSPRSRRASSSRSSSGPLAGYPVIDVKVTLTDGGFHAVDSSADRVRSRGQGRLSPDDAQGRPAAARADHEGRRVRARRARRRRHRRPQPPPRHDQEPGSRPDRACASRPTCRSARCSATSATCAR